MAGTLSLAILLVGSEVASRAYWWMAHGVDPARPDQLLEAVYPELRLASAAAAPCATDCLRVLLLGGSVLDPRWSRVPEQIEAGLRARTTEPRIVNLAVPGHSSRDSLLKYRAIDLDPELRDLRFDLVLFYHGINETRANNVPPDRFRPDYGHYAWYERVNALAPAGDARFFLPATLRWARVLLRQALQPDAYVPIQAPRPEWLQFGNEARSAASFRANLEEVVAIAERRGEPLALSTFAVWRPADYSLERFEAHSLDYSGHFVPIELWGEPDHVMAAVEAHNREVVEVAGNHSRILFLDLAGELPGGGEWFCDVCHLTEGASARLVDGILGLADSRMGWRETTDADPRAAG